MAFPFTAEQFLDVIAQYNTMVWPMQIILYALAALSLFFVFRPNKHSDKLIVSILAFFWLWMGIIYHWLFFSPINKAAYLFGALFVIQAGVIAFAGFREKLSFGFRKDAYGIVGGILLACGLIIYPLLTVTFGHVWPNNPTFGLPCPTTIFTFGLFLWTKRRIPRYLLIIPLLWALIGVSAAINFGIWEDLLLVVAGILGTTLLLIRDKKE